MGHGILPPFPAKKHQILSVDRLTGELVADSSTSKWCGVKLSQFTVNCHICKPLDNSCCFKPAYMLLQEMGTVMSHLQGGLEDCKGNVRLL